MSDAEFEIINADAGASNVFPKQAGTVRKGEYAMLNGFPCRVTDTATSKTGKHGHAKINLTGIDIFTGRKYEDIYPTSHNMSIPIVKKFELLVTELEDGEITLMTEQGELSHVKLLPEAEETTRLTELFADGVPSDDVYASIIDWDGRQQVVGVRTTKAAI